MNIFFDFDGTLIDSKTRLYQLFRYLVPESKFTFNEYWKLKQNKVNHKTILLEYYNIEGEEYMSFEEKWLKLIETEYYLDFDIPFEGTTLFLKKLKENGSILYLVTSRQSINSVKYQLRKFEWEAFFKDILVTEQKKKKEDLIKPFLKIECDNIIIGDTGYDIQTGKNLGIYTVAVISGFLSREILEQYNPDFILNNVVEFNPLIFKQT